MADTKVQYIVSAETECAYDGGTTWLRMVHARCAGVQPARSIAKALNGKVRTRNAEIVEVRTTRIPVPIEESETLGLTWGSYASALRNREARPPQENTP